MVHAEDKSFRLPGEGMAAMGDGPTSRICATFCVSKRCSAVLMGSAWCADRAATAAAMLCCCRDSEEY